MDPDAMNADLYPLKSRLHTLEISPRLAMSRGNGGAPERSTPLMVMMMIIVVVVIIVVVGLVFHRRLAGDHCLSVRIRRRN